MLKNKHQAVSQGENQLKAPGSKLIGKNPIRFQLSVSSFQLPLCEHLQEPRNDRSRTEAPFLNTRLSHQ
jgi:hypothetical protein